MGKESWKAVVGYEGLYEVSDAGNVRSVDKFTRDGRFWKGREIGKHRAGSGYLRAVLCVDGVSHHEYIHRLVANAFLPNPEMKPEVNHKDGNKHNNSVSNLEWVTKSENGLHMRRVLGIKVVANMLNKPSHARKLTDEQVVLIRSSTRTSKALAKELGVSDSTVQDIRKFKKYTVRMNGEPW